MQALEKFDRESVQHFLADLGSRQLDCHGEGQYCSKLDERIDCQCDVCADLLNAVVSWASGVHRGEIGFDPTVELLFLERIRTAISVTQPLVDEGNDVEADCYTLGRLDALEDMLYSLTKFIDSWISPRKSAAPAPRVKIPDDVMQQMKEQIANVFPPKTK